MDGVGVGGGEVGGFQIKGRFELGIGAKDVVVHFFLEVAGFIEATIIITLIHGHLFGLFLNGGEVFVAPWTLIKEQGVADLERVHFQLCDRLGVFDVDALLFVTHHDGVGHKTGGAFFKGDGALGFAGVFCADQCQIIKAREGAWFGVLVGLEVVRFDGIVS